MLTMNLCLSSLRRWFSLRTDSLLFLARMLPQYTRTLLCSFPSWPIARPPSSTAPGAPGRILPFPAPTGTHSSFLRAFRAGSSLIVPIISRSTPWPSCCPVWARPFQPNCSWLAGGRLSWRTSPWKSWCPECVEPALVLNRAGAAVWQGEGCDGACAIRFCWIFCWAWRMCGAAWE